MRFLLAGLAALLPQRLKHLVYRKALGWDVHPTARIGCSFIYVDHAVIEAGVHMSHFNVIKNLEGLHLERDVAIGAFNWVSALPRGSSAFPHAPDRTPRLHMGPESAMTMRHVVDCSDQVTFEAMASLAGLRSQILTHSIDIHRNRQVTEPVVIGARSIVFANCTLLIGCRIPSRCVVAAGSTVNSGLVVELQVYGGSPARAVKALAADNAYISREKGFVD